ncbi:MAG: hypothetical protein ACKVVT_10490 [Dehalococcoidia bacterium]
MTGVRGFLAAYSLLFLALCALLIALAWDQGRQLDLGLGDWNLRAFITAGNAEKWAFTVLMALLGLMALATFALAVTPQARGRSAQRFKVRHADGSWLEVDTEALERMVETEVLGLPDVMAAEVYIQFFDKRVFTEVDAAIAPAANVSYMTQAISFAVARVLGDQVGLQLVRRPSITFRFEDPAPPATSPAPRGLSFDPPTPERADV